MYLPEGLFVNENRGGPIQYRVQAAGDKSRYVPTSPFLSPDALQLPNRGLRIRSPVDRPHDAEVPGAAAKHLREVPAVDPAKGDCRHRRRSDDRRHPLEAEDRVGNRLGRGGEHRTDPDVVG